MVRNPKTISWSHDGRDTDEALLPVADILGFVLFLDGAEHFLIPLAWNVNGTYEYPIADAEIPKGVHSIELTLRLRDGTESARSAAVAFQLVGVPKAPFALSVR